MVRCWQLWPEAQTRRRNVISQVRYQFGHNSPPGFTAVVVLDESHCSCHTYADLGLIALDVFTCGKPIRKTFCISSGKKSTWAMSPSGKCLVLSWNRKRRAHWKNQWPLRHNPRVNPGWRLPWISRSLHDGREDGLEPLESLSRRRDKLPRPVARDVQNGVFRPPARRGLRRSAADDRRPFLPHGFDHLRRHDRRQAGSHRLRHDRSRARAGRDRHRGPDRPRSDRVDRTHSLSAQPGPE